MVSTWMVLMALVAAQPGLSASVPVSFDAADTPRWLTVLGVTPVTIRSSRQERLIVLGADGRVVRIVDGGEGHVPLPADLDRLLNRPGEGLTLVHNHPSGNGLSADDLSQLDKAGVATVVAVGHDGSVYAASRGARFPAAGFTGFDDAVYDTARQAAHRVQSSERDPQARAAFDAHMHHVLAQALTAAGVLTYRFTLGADRSLSFSNARVYLARVRNAARPKIGADR